MLDLGALKLSIQLDSKEANKGLEDFKQNTDKAESKSKISFSSIKGAIIGAGITTAIIGASKALWGMATDAAATADRIDKLSAKTGLSREGFQEWDYVLAQNGASIEGMQMGMKTLTGLMDSAASGTQSAQETFKALNLTWEDGNGNLKSQEEMMNDALYALANMENGTEKARLATELFGKSGSELMPMLNNGAASMDELKQRAHELGLVMSDEAVDGGVKLGDTIDDVKKSFGAIITQIGVYVMPIIQTLLDWVLSHMPEIQAVCKVVFDAIGGAVQFVIDIIKILIDMYNQWAEQNQDKLEVIKTIFNNSVKGIKLIFDSFIKLLKGDWAGLWDNMKQILKLGWDNICKLIPLLLEGAIAIFKGYINIWKNIGSSIFNAVWDGMKGVWNSICSWVSEKVNWLIDKLAFWRSGSKEINGSHRVGLREVPFDGYTAELHRGEMVLTAAEAKRYQQGETQTAANSTVLTVNNYSPKALNEAESARLFKQSQRELALGF